MIALWEYILLAYVIVVGIRTLQSHSVSLRNLLLFPAIVVVWSVYNLIQQRPTLWVTMLWILFLGIGCIIGWWLIHMSKTRVEKAKHALFIEGNIITLLLIGLFIAIFFLAKLKPNIFLPFLGFFTGVFMGRGLCFLKKYLTAH